MTTDYTKSFIFQSHFVEAILRGRKTETRRICKNLPRVGKRARFITQRGGKPFATARIDSVKIQRLGMIGHKDALHEGCPSACAGDPQGWFKRIWTEMHGKWNPRQEVYVITWDQLEHEQTTP